MTTAGELDRVAAARRLLAELGVDPAELIGSTPVRSMPTVGEFLRRVRPAATPAMLRTYGAYWDRLEHAWAARPLDSVVASDILAWMQQLQASARQRGARRDGRHAAPADQQQPRSGSACLWRSIAENALTRTSRQGDRVAAPCSGEHRGSGYRS